MEIDDEETKKDEESESLKTKKERETFFGVSNINVSSDYLKGSGHMIDQPS